MNIKIKILNYKVFGGRRWYQYFDFGEGVNNFKYVGERGKYRTQSFVEFIDNLQWGSSEKVVDVGCNAGRYCYEISKKVDSVVGVELSKAFYKQSLYLKDLYLENGYDLSNVKIENADITKRFSIFDGATTVFLSKVLYHKSLNGLGEEILKYISSRKVGRIIVQGHTTQGELGEDMFIASILEGYGYKVQHIDNHDEYPILVAIKDRVN